MANNFISRWSKRKLDQEESVEVSDFAVTHAQLDDSQVTSNELDSDVVESKESQDTSKQSVASLLISEAESTVKKAALRKLFLSGEFSEIDGLNDYDHDYKSVKSLSSDVAEKLRDWMQETEEEAITLEERSSLQDEELEQSEKEQPTDAVVEQVGQNIPHKE